MSRKLFCFDFDQTLVNGHFHNTICNAKLKRKEQLPQFVDQLLADPNMGLKNSKEVKEIMRSALQNGHSVAIVSFTSFPQCFEPTLRKIGLTSEEIALIGKFHGFPTDPKNHKNEHLKKAMEYAKITDNSAVYLIDDDPANCEHAARFGCQAVVVPSEKNSPPFYLRNVIDIANQP